MEELSFKSLSSVAELLRTRQLSPIELCTAMLRRIEAIDPQLKSYATVTAELALEQAKRSEEEIQTDFYRGPLHGIPVAVKDLCYTRGIPTMGGLKIRKGFVPEYDGTVVARLAAAGAVLLGKLNLTEGALSAYNTEFPIPVNPWDSRLWSGVSSSGTGVAVAAGLCYVGIGTDTGGSIRYPAMANGVVGMKPTWGRVSRYGLLALAESLDHVGPMARTVEDAATMFVVLAGQDSSDPSTLSEPVPDQPSFLSENLSGLTLGVDERYLTTGTDIGLVAAIEKALEILQTLGARLVEVSMPAEGPMDYRDLWLPLVGYEAYRAHGEYYPERADEYGDYLSGVLEMGRSLSAEEYSQAKDRRAAFNRRFVAELEKVDAVICPSGGMVFPVEQSKQYGNAEVMKEVVKHFQGQFTIPADLAGTPTLSLCCGFNEKGWPYGMQFMGRRLSEATLCRFGHAYQQATSWHQHHPSLTTEV
ncbi:MAG: amidase [Gammaproteobacteria bacterium]|nr:amidase [Gammaproteobacteria bacterium]